MLKVPTLAKPTWRRITRPLELRPRVDVHNRAGAIRHEQRDEPRMLL
jgi:hypothetical protein